MTLGKALGWKPLPLTIKEGRRFASLADRPRQSRTHAARQNAREQTSASAALDARDVWHADGGQEILRGASLAASAGELVALMGRNGSGKTTLLQMLSSDWSGRSADRCWSMVRMCETSPPPTICRQVGYVPQNPARCSLPTPCGTSWSITLRNHGLEATRPSEPGELLSTLGWKMSPSSIRATFPSVSSSATRSLRCSSRARASCCSTSRPAGWTMPPRPPSSDAPQTMAGAGRGHRHGDARRGTRRDVRRPRGADGRGRNRRGWPGAPGAVRVRHFLLADQQALWRAVTADGGHS